MKDKKIETPIEYVADKYFDKLLLLKRKKGDDKTVPCPFCGVRHIHGTSDGHRVAHCGTYDGNESVTAPDGTVLFKKDGYVLQTID